MSLSPRLLSSTLVELQPYDFDLAQHGQIPRLIPHAQDRESTDMSMKDVPRHALLAITLPSTRQITHRHLQLRTGRIHQPKHNATLAALFSAGQRLALVLEIQDFPAHQEAEQGNHSLTPHHQG